MYKQYRNMFVMCDEDRLKICLRKTGTLTRGDSWRGIYKLYHLAKSDVHKGGIFNLSKILIQKTTE